VILLKNDEVIDFVT